MKIQKILSIVFLFPFFISGLVTDKIATTFTHIANIGLGYKLTEEYLLKTNFTYVPEYDGVGSTSGTNTIFMQVSLGF